MGLIGRIRDFFTLPFKKKEYPLYETCAVCGERTYLPFRCEYCNRYYCDRHRLPFDHDCSNIAAWKNRPAGPGKSGK
jgi:predicted nucleic acid binding AN1-type Zn finger protein